MKKAKLRKLPSAEKVVEVDKELQAKMQLMLVGIEQQKTEIVKQILAKLSVSWEDETFKRITSFQQEGSFIQKLVLDHKTDNEKHLCTFQTKFQKNDLFLDVKSQYL